MIKINIYDGSTSAWLEKWKNQADQSNAVPTRLFLDCLEYRLGPQIDRIPCIAVMQLTQDPYNNFEEFVKRIPQDLRGNARLAANDSGLLGFSFSSAN